MRIKRVSGLVVLAVLALVASALPLAAQDGPLDVDEAVRIALRQNYSYKRAQAGVGVAKGARLESVASLLPRFSGSGDYTKVDRSGTETTLEVNGLSVPSVANPTDIVQSSTQYSLNITQSFSIPLWYQFRSSNAQLRSAEYGRAATAQQLAYDVRQQFYLLLRAKDLLIVQTEDLRLATDEERRINSMFELGSVAKVDVLKARVRLADAEVALIRQQNQVEIERARLATFLGLPPDTHLNIDGALAGSTSQVDSLQAIADAGTRPDLLQARAALGSASNQFTAALTSRLPELYANFSIDKSTGDSDLSTITFDPDVGGLVPFSRLTDNEADGWRISVGARVNLDAFLNMGTHSRTRAAQRQAQYDLEGLELQIKRELEEAILNYRSSARSIGAAESGVESAEEDLRLSQERYRQGLGTVLELLEAQVNLTRARNNLVNAQTGLRISEAALDKARGAPLPY